MNRVHVKPQSRFFGTLVGWALCIAGALVGALILLSGLYAVPDETTVKPQVAILLGLGILIFFFAGLPKGAREDKSTTKPHTTR